MNIHITTVQEVGTIIIPILLTEKGQYGEVTKPGRGAIVWRLQSL